MSHDVEPLETGVWLAQLGDLATHPPQGDAALAVALRRGFYLAQLAPRPLRHLVACQVPENEFEQLLESGSLLRAALALLGKGLNYTLSHMDSAGRIEAEVWFSSECQGGMAAASSPPAAIFAAWLESLLALDENVGLGEAPPSLPVRRKCLSARRPRLTEH